MKLLKYLFLIFILVGNFSCKKLQYETTNIQASVYDEIVKIYLANIKISLEEREFDRGLGSKNYTSTILKEAFTDANGQVDFGDMELRKNGRYEYYLVRDHFDYPVKKGKSNNIQIKVNNCIVKLKVLFSPAPPYNTGDSLSVKFTNTLGGYITITNTNYAGSQATYSLFYPGYFFINIDKYKSGIYTNTLDTVFYPSLGNYDYTVNW